MSRNRNRSTYAAAMLAMEAQQVIALRLMRLAAGGPAAKVEARRMATEKVLATQKAMGLLATAAASGKPGNGPDAVVRMLRGRVRANRKRLARVRP